MTIGIISDTHDNLHNLKKAIEILNARGCTHLLHAGDYTSPFTWRVILEFKGEFTGIFGNNDGDRIFLRKLFSDRIFPQPHRLTLHDTAPASARGRDRLHPRGATAACGTTRPATR